jgi:hypothetical protein
MTMSHPSDVEQLKYTLTDHHGNHGKLELAWANMAGTVDFTVK